MLGFHCSNSLDVEIFHFYICSFLSPPKSHWMCGMRPFKQVKIFVPFEPKQLNSFKDSLPCKSMGSRELFLFQFFQILLFCSSIHDSSMGKFWFFHQCVEIWASSMCAQARAKCQILLRIKLTILLILFSIHCLSNRLQISILSN